MLSSKLFWPVLIVETGQEGEWKYTTFPESWAWLWEAFASATFLRPK